MIDTLQISIHTPLAGSDFFAGVGFVVDFISIHTPLAGSDLDGTVLPALFKEISIHTPLAGSD